MIKSIIALFLLSLYTILDFVAYMPQIIQLIKTKSAEDLNLSSWLVWIVSEISYLTYILMETPEKGVIFIALLNLAFAVWTCFLIALYKGRKKHEHKRK